MIFPAKLALLPLIEILSIEEEPFKVTFPVIVEALAKKIPAIFEEPPRVIPPVILD